MICHPPAPSPVLPQGKAKCVPSSTSDPPNIRRNIPPYGHVSHQTTEFASRLCPIHRGARSCCGCSNRWSSEGSRVFSPVQCSKLRPLPSAYLLSSTAGV